MLTWLWALVAPWAGPAVAWLLPKLPFGAFSGLKTGLRLLSWVLVLGAGILAAWLVLSHLRDPVKDYVSLAEVNAQSLKAQNRALRQAAAAKDELVAEREQENAALEAEILSLKRLMEDSRALSPDPDAVVYPADDPWLQSKRARNPRAP